MKNPIIEEVRRHRMEHARKFNFDLDAICADLRRIQEESGRPVVRLCIKKRTMGRRIASAD